MRGTEGKDDVLVVAAWTHGMPEPVVFLQRFLPKAQGEFALVGPIIAQEYLQRSLIGLRSPS